MENHAEFLFYLTTVFLENEKEGTVTAFFAQFPQASAEGRSKDEARQLLQEIFPIMLEDKAEEYIQKFHRTATQAITFEKQAVHA